jgi:hypothetical protein
MKNDTQRCESRSQVDGDLLAAVASHGPAGRSDPEKLAARPLRRLNYAWSGVRSQVRAPSDERRLRAQDGRWREPCRHSPTNGTGHAVIHDGQGPTNPTIAALRPSGVSGEARKAANGLHEGAGTPQEAYVRRSRYHRPAPCAEALGSRPRRCAPRGGGPSVTVSGRPPKRTRRGNCSRRLGPQ